MGRYKKGILCVTVGVLLIAAAFYSWGENLWDSYHAQEYSEQLLKNAVSNMTMPTYAYAESPEESVNAEPDHHEAVDGILGILDIPGIKISLPVQSEYSMKNLKKSPCRYYGRDGKQTRLVICAHNYDRHLGRLKELYIGDEITFTYMDGITIRYVISESTTIEPDDFESVEAGKWDLALFTCTPGGAKRILVKGIIKE